MIFCYFTVVSFNFHIIAIRLDTSRVKAKSEKSLLSPKTAQHSRENAYVLTSKVAKGYSHLEVSEPHSEAEVVDVMGSEAASPGEHCQLVVTEAGNGKEQNRPKNNTFYPHRGS